MTEEIFDIVNETGEPTGLTISRKEAHRQGARHRTAHIWVLDRSTGVPQVLLQQRSEAKDSFPGQWDTSSAGHIHAGDEPLISALRELEEELGIHAEAEELTFAGTFDIAYELPFHGEMFRDNEISFVYIYERPVDPAALTLQAEEVQAVRWFTVDAVLEACANRDGTVCVPTGGIMTVKHYLDRDSH